MGTVNIKIQKPRGAFEQDAIDRRKNENRKANARILRMILAVYTMGISEALVTITRKVIIY